MVAHGKILLICDDKSYANYIKEQLLGLRDYSISIESTAQAGLVSLRQSGCDIIFIRYGVPEIDTASLKT